MLGQPVYFLTPDVVGFEFTGRLREGVHRHRPGAHRHRDPAQARRWSASSSSSSARAPRSLAVPDRATIANMAPEYGATMGFFPVDDKTIEYFEGTGRTKAEIEAFEAYFKAQGLFGVPRAGEIDYTQVVTLDLGTVAPSLAGPEAAAGPHRDRQRQEPVHRRCSASRRPRTASTSRPSSC